MSLTQPVHFLVIKSLLMMPLASTLSPTFLSSQGIYSQMFTGPTPSPVSLLHVGEKDTFAETLKSTGFFVFRVISTEHLLGARHCAYKLSIHLISLKKLTQICQGTSRR